MPAQITPFQPPNVAGVVMGLLEQKRAAQATAADEFNAQARLLKEENERKKDAAEFAMNMLAGVQSQDDLRIAKSILKVRYPNDPEVDMVPDEYDPKTISMITNSLMDAKSRLDREKFEWEKTEKITQVPQGSAVMQGGKVTAIMDNKAEYDVFQGPDGNQVYMRKGQDIPPGFQKVLNKGGSTNIEVNTGDLSKPTKTKVEQNIIDAEKNIASFASTKSLFKPEYLTYVGKGEKELALIMDRAGVSTGDQKKLVAERANWFRQAKADFIAYRKWATGVAGGEKELEEIATSFPDPVKNSPEEYIANLNSIDETTRRVLEMDRDYLQSGISFGAKPTSSAPATAPTAPATNRVIQYDSNGKRIK